MDDINLTERLIGIITSDERFFQNLYRIVHNRLKSSTKSYKKNRQFITQIVDKVIDEILLEFDIESIINETKSAYRKILNTKKNKLENDNISSPHEIENSKEDDDTIRPRYSDKEPNFCLDNHKTIHFGRKADKYSRKGNTDKQIISLTNNTEDKMEAWEKIVNDGMSDSNKHEELFEEFIEPPVVNRSDRIEKLEIETEAIFNNLSSEKSDLPSSDSKLEIDIKPSLYTLGGQDDLYADDNFDGYESPIDKKKIALQQISDKKPPTQLKKARFDEDPVSHINYGYRAKYSSLEKIDIFYNHEEESKFINDQAIETDYAESLGMTWNEWIHRRTDEEIQRDENNHFYDITDNDEIISNEYEENPTYSPDNDEWVVQEDPPTKKYDENWMNGSFGHGDDGDENSAF